MGNNLASNTTANNNNNNNNNNTATNQSSSWLSMVINSNSNGNSKNNNIASITNTAMFLRNSNNIEWEHEDIYLDLSEEGLGISIRGGIDSPNHLGNTDIYVSRILNSGAVQRDGRIKLGDILLHVNGQPLVGVTHGQAVNLILNSGPYIHFGIRRRKDDIYESINEDNGSINANNNNNINEDVPLLMGNNRRYEDDYDDDDNYNYFNGTDNHTKTYNNCIKVELTRDEIGFGFSLEGGIDSPISSDDNGLYINNIIQNSPAHKNGQIAIGDEIVAVNDTNLECVPHRWAIDAIRNSPALSVFTIRKQINWD